MEALFSKSTPLLSRLGTLVVLSLVALFMMGSIAFAAESWMADAKTGVKVGWAGDDWTLTAVSWTGPAVDGKAEGRGALAVTVRYKDGKVYQGTGEVEMLAGFLDGKVVFKWSDGETYEGDYKKGRREGFGKFVFLDGSSYEGEWVNGLQEGKGLLKFKDGRTYEGEFKKGVSDGFGVGKDAKGNIVHEGQWKNGQPLIPLKADKILGIPWGGTDEQAKAAMKLRPKTDYVPYFNGKDANTRWLYFFGPFADFPDAWIYVYFYQDKMWQVQVSWPLKEDEVMDRFSNVKKGLTERYGAPSAEQGKYLDSLIWWDLGEKHFVNLQIKKNTIKLGAADPTPQTKPYRVNIFYYNKAVADIIYPQNKPGATSSDY